MKKTEIIKTISNAIYDYIAEETKQRYECDNTTYKIDVEVSENKCANVIVNYALEVINGYSGNWDTPADADDYEFTINEIKVIELQNENSIELTNLIQAINKELTTFENNIL